MNNFSISFLNYLINYYNYDCNSIFFINFTDFNTNLLSKFYQKLIYFL